MLVSEKWLIFAKTHGTKTPNGVKPSLKYHHFVYVVYMVVNLLYISMYIPFPLYGDQCHMAGSCYISGEPFPLNIWPGIGGSHVVVPKWLVYGIVLSTQFPLKLKGLGPNFPPKKTPWESPGVGASGFSHRHRLKIARAYV